MLTGDKIETAINIGHSTNLLTKNSELIIIDGEENEKIFFSINEELKKVFFKKINILIPYFYQDLYVKQSNKRFLFGFKRKCITLSPREQ